MKRPFTIAGVYLLIVGLLLGWFLGYHSRSLMLDWPRIKREGLGQIVLTGLGIGFGGVLALIVIIGLMRFIDKKTAEDARKRHDDTDLKPSPDGEGRPAQAIEEEGEDGESGLTS